MPTLDLCPRPRRNPSRSRGFTLLEILVVITIIGLMTAAVAPGMSTMYDRIDFAMSRENFEHGINALSYEAFSTNTDLILKPTTERGVEALARLGSAAPDVLGREVKAPARAGWGVYIDEPIIFRASGYCKGGALSLKVGSYIANYVLRPPYCQVEAVP